MELRMTDVLEMHAKEASPNMVLRLLEPQVWYLASYPKYPSGESPEPIRHYFIGLMKKWSFVMAVTSNLIPTSIKPSSLGTQSIPKLGLNFNPGSIRL